MILLSAMWYLIPFLLRVMSIDGLLLDATQLVPHSLEARLLGNAGTTCYFRHDADVERSFFFEQRGWLTYLNYSDLVDYRKREKAEGYLLSVSAAWAMPPSFSYGSSDGARVRTTLLGSDMLMAWLHGKFRHLGKGQRKQQQEAVSSCLAACYKHTCRGRSLLADAPTVSAGGVELPLLDDCTLDMDRLSSLYPYWPEEWLEILQQGDGAALGRPPETNHVALPSLLSFLEARVHYTQRTLPAGHWIVRLRNVLLKMAGFLFEVSISDVLENTAEQTVRNQPHEPIARVRRRWSGMLSKGRLITKMIRNFGSGNAVVNSLVDGHRGFSAMITHLSNSSTLEENQKRMASCNLASCYRDGASYGVLSVNLGFGANVETDFAARFKPMVPPPLWTKRPQHSPPPGGVGEHFARRNPQSYIALRIFGGFFFPPRAALRQKSQ